MIAVDTSVVVAAFASWHEGHERAQWVLADRPRIPAQVLIETYSVLTRLPPPHRAAASIVETFLKRRFPEPPLTLPHDEYRKLLQSAAKRGISGGAIYDALIAATVNRAGASLATRDRRAARTYDAMQTPYDLAL